MIVDLSRLIQFLHLRTHHWKIEKCNNLMNRARSTLTSVTLLRTCGLKQHGWMDTFPSRLFNCKPLTDTSKTPLHLNIPPNKCEAVFAVHVSVLFGTTTTGGHCTPVLACLPSTVHLVFPFPMKRKMGKLNEQLIVNTHSNETSQSIVHTICLFCMVWKMKRLDKLQKANTHV